MKPTLLLLSLISGLKMPPFRLIMPCLVLMLASGYAGAGPHKPAFEDFLQRFLSSLIHHDAGTVADLTQLPFLYENHALDRAAFINIVPELFNDKVSACLANAEPNREEDRHVLYCSPYAFYFGRGQDGAYRLIEFGVDGEDMP